MKKKVIAIPIIAAVVVFIISYTTIENSSFENLSESKIEKKAMPLVKAKAKKKPVKKKATSATKTKAEASSAATEASESETAASTENTTIRNIIAKKVYNYAAQNDLSTEYCFLVDMSLPSGKNRLFVYDMTRNTIVYSMLVAHGSCNETFLARPRFSNESKSGCSSLGKFKVGEFYNGKYGKSYRLHGLDNCNSNAYKRAVVIHGFGCVPDEEIYPRVLCNSLGCVMVSYQSFDRLSRVIKKTGKPIVLWIYQ